MVLSLIKILPQKSGVEKVVDLRCHRFRHDEDDFLVVYGSAIVFFKSQRVRARRAHQNLLGVSTQVR